MVLNFKDWDVEVLQDYKGWIQLSFWILESWKLGDWFLDWWMFVNCLKFLLWFEYLFGFSCLRRKINMITFEFPLCGKKSMPWYWKEILFLVGK